MTSRTVRRVSLVLPLALLAGCEPTRPQAAPDATAAPAVEPNTVQGRVTDAAGNPLPNTTIHIYGTTMAGENARFEVQPGPDGRYRQRVPEGIYGLRAEFRHTDAAGRPILLVLHPADGVTGQRHDSAEGIRKDFEWRISGLKPGQAAGEPGRHDEWGKYYGGSLQVSIAAERSDAPAAFPDGSVLTLTLTPRGPLLDGRPANPLTYERTFGCGVSAGSYWYPADIPLGTYDLAARLRTPDGADRPLPLRPGLGSHDFAPSVTLDVLPAADGSVLPIQITVLP